MPDMSPVRVLLVEDSAVLAGRITELIRRLPRVALIGTVDTEADALQQIHEQVTARVQFNVLDRSGGLPGFIPEGM